MVERRYGEAGRVDDPVTARAGPGHVTALTPSAARAVPSASAQPEVAGAGGAESAGVPRAVARALAADTRRALLAGAVGVAAVAALLTGPAGFGTGVLVRALALYGLGATLVWRALRARPERPAHPHACFGMANRVTLLRMAGLAMFGALVGEPALGPGGSEAAVWTLIVVATVIAVLDAVDGPLARRSGLASAFGARFDMETDAALTLVLSALVLHAGRAGAWVLAIGGMRYAFVAATALWPWLAGPLAPSRRRQTVCVVTITVLIVALGPIVPTWLATALTATALALLSLSFAVDVRALAHAHRASMETRP